MAMPGLPILIGELLTTTGGLACMAHDGDTGTADGLAIMRFELRILGLGTPDEPTDAHRSTLGSLRHWPAFNESMALFWYLVGLCMADWGTVFWVMAQAPIAAADVLVMNWSRVG